MPEEAVLPGPRGELSQTSRENLKAVLCRETKLYMVPAYGTWVVVFGDGRGAVVAVDTDLMERRADTMQPVVGLLQRGKVGVLNVGPQNSGKEDGNVLAVGCRQDTTEDPPTGRDSPTKTESRKMAAEVNLCEDAVQLVAVATGNATGQELPHHRHRHHPHWLNPLSICHLLRR